MAMAMLGRLAPCRYNWAIFRIAITKEMSRVVKTTLHSILAARRRTRKVHPCLTPRKRQEMW